MASRSALFLAMLFISTMSTANSLLLIHNGVNTATVVGQVLCTTPPPFSTPPEPLGSIVVSLFCGGSSQTEASTDSEGFFRLTPDPLTPELEFNLDSCHVEARIPGDRCLFYGGTTVLSFKLKLVYVVPSLGIGRAFLVAIPPYGNDEN